MRLKARALHHMMGEKIPQKDLLAKYPELASFVNFYPQSYGYFQTVGDLNLAEYWLKTDAHVLMIHGAGDFLSFGKDHDLIAKIVNKKSPGKGTYMELPNSDHWLNNVSTMQESLQVVQQRSRVEKNYQFNSIVAKWILDKLDNKALGSKDK